MAICKAPVGPRAGVTKNDAKGITHMEMDVYKIRRHWRLIAMAYGPYNANKIEV
jgi:hypothetical protein